MTIGKFIEYLKDQYPVNAEMTIMDSTAIFVPSMETEVQHPLEFNIYKA